MIPPVAQFTMYENLIYTWGKLFGRIVPLFGGTVLPNKTLFGETIPPNNTLFSGTIPPNITLFGGTPDSEKPCLICLKCVKFMDVAYRQTLLN